MNVMRWICYSLFLWAVAEDGWAGTEAIHDVSESIVKIYTVHNRADYYNPWSMQGPRASTGSGCIIEGNKILSNAHVVSDQTFVQVRRYGDPRKYQARVAAVSHDVDLALLEVLDEQFFDSVPALELGSMPELQQEVFVYGFPLGGDMMSITKGVISRIEHQRYTHSSGRFLAGQIDAAINPGNSGGPVVVDGDVVGVVMQGIPSAQNIGYMVPVNRIRHFFKDLEDGQYDGIPSMGIGLQDAENESMQRRFHLPKDKTGVLVNKVIAGSPAEGTIQKGDLLLEVDGHRVATDGTIEFRDKERTLVSYFVQEKQVGDTIRVSLLRNGAVLESKIALSRPYNMNYLVPMEQYETLPSYYIYGGVVFLTLTKNLLQVWGNDWFNRAPKNLTAILNENYPEKEGQQVVVVLKVLASDINEGYHNMNNLVVDRVNGVIVDNMHQFVELVEQGDDQVFLEIETREGYLIVLDRTLAEERNQDILKTYRIASDHSQDLQ